MTERADKAALLAALAWQVEAGADEAIGEAPLERYRGAARAAPPPPAGPPPTTRPRAALAGGAAKDPDGERASAAGATRAARPARLEASAEIGRAARELASAAR